MSLNRFIFATLLEGDKKMIVNYSSILLSALNIRLQSVVESELCA